MCCNGAAQGGCSHAKGQDNLTIQTRKKLVSVKALNQTINRRDFFPNDIRFHA